ncbi:CHAD domain-containing protein (plasmid) [Phyllobacterium sp. 628]|uniref:CYTH and CHAD domain-containing protein n=1 Tax=Phyllobacterium sp. 628 TaxID=2718938 RepID=UPI0016625132|nr:CYTH and CHAD domain-containing protein [Phyllobacterium sp. 628]QND54487.1 CHAD domain-containing protein [Phyllobacterium sp. 628]
MSKPNAKTAASQTEGDLPREIELKLLFHAKDINKITNATAIAQVAKTGWTSTDLTAIYFDTENFDLHKSGYALRVRNNGNHKIMTLKSNSMGAALLERMEWEVPVEGMTPDVGALDMVLPTELMQQVKDSGLQPAFTSVVKRLTRLLAQPHGMIELAIDCGRIDAEKRSETISELELELKEGMSEAIFQLAQDLGTIIAVWPSVRSKSQRGFDLVFDRPPLIVKEPDPIWDRHVTLESVLEAILRSTYRNVMENQAVAMDGREPEGLHQYRVALRRLRSVLRLVQTFSASLPPATFREDAKRLLTYSNDARDWDVFWAEAIPKIKQAQASAQELETLKHGAEQGRAKAYNKIRKAAGDPRTGMFLIELGLWIEQKGWRDGLEASRSEVLAETGRKFARKALQKLHGKVLKRGRHFAKLDPNERHRVRIALKRLRYTADFLLPLIHHKKSGRKYIKIIASLQDELGRSNDKANTKKALLQISGSKALLGGYLAAHTGVERKKRLVKGDDHLMTTAWKAFQAVRIP